ncbi:MAG: Rpn family recombination-promoting nuclease/putative transposase [Rhodospirillales bacterium]|nr:Rpn family recombination-promoting nuclease/putative transposase [Rhodospirillales bacterium]
MKELVTAAHRRTHDEHCPPVAEYHRREAGPVSLPTTPHDALFRALVANPARAGVLLAEYLPQQIADLLDPASPPEAVEGSFVDADAARTQCDALFRVRLKSGHQARIYVLLEHKSSVDAGTPLQILKYMVNIWLREIEGSTAGDRLPPIIPLVFYHGQGQWTAARSVAEMIEAPAELAPFLREFAYVVHDLGEIAPLRLSRTPEVRAGLLALKVVHAVAIPPDILDQMTGGPVAGSKFERHIVRYIAERMNLTPALLEASLRRTKPDRWEALMVTVAEAWIEQGRAEGIEKGLAQGITTGQAGLLLRLLELRFGELPETVGDRVRGASASELEAWAGAVLVAESLDEVLAVRPGPRVSDRRGFTGTRQKPLNGV